VAPDWALLVLLLPGASLAVAFVGDRFYAAWRSPASNWPDTSAAYLLLGLLAAIGFNGAVAYYHFAATGGEAASYVGRAVRAAPQAAVLVASPAAGMSLPSDEVVRFLAGDTRPALYAVADLPAALPPASHVIILPADTAALDAVRTRYPGGALTVVRDLRANPRLLVYQTPEQQQ
jgi:hypothetical protein